jgi:hypothetical protein
VDAVLEPIGIRLMKHLHLVREWNNMFYGHYAIGCASWLIA